MKLRDVDVLQGKWLTILAKPGHRDVWRPRSLLRLVAASSGEFHSDSGAQPRQTAVRVLQSQRDHPTRTPLRKEQRLSDASRTGRPGDAGERVDDSRHSFRCSQAEKAQGQVQFVVHTQILPRLEDAPLPKAHGLRCGLRQFAADEEAQTVSAVRHGVSHAVSRR